MREQSYKIRRYRLGDLDKLAKLAAEIQGLEHPHCCNLLHSMIENLCMPNCCPEHNLFVVDVAGTIVGCADVVPELRIGRVVLCCLLHPKHRTRTLTRELLTQAMDRATQLEADIIHALVTENNMITRNLLSSMGFRAVRRFLEMRLDLSTIPLLELKRVTGQYRQLRHGEEDLIAEIQNRAFGNSWGYNPNTAEEIMYRIRQMNFSTADVIVVCDADKPAGYCWIKTKVREKDSPDGRTGRIHMLGVDPYYWGKGVGKQVLMAALYHLKTNDVRFVELTVDSENEAACVLYTLAGFEVWTNSIWYEKTIR